MEGNWQTAKRLLDMNIQGVPMLWGNFLPKRGLAGLTGSSDCGKSTFLRSLAIAIAQGKNSFLGYPLDVTHSAAYYLSTEDEHESISAWLNRHVVDKRKTGYLQNFVFLCDPADVVKTLDAKLAEKQADIAIIDTWADTFHGSLNNPIHVRESLSPLQELARKYNCLIMLMHHTVKSADRDSPDKAKLNGSGAIEQKLRSLLELRRGDTAERRYLTVLKNNYMPDQAKELSIELNFDETTLGFESTGREVVIKGDKEVRVQFDKNVWVERMNELRRGGFSYDRAYKRLVILYPNENVPKPTWFKENCR